jgi:hypothetical protein
MAYDTIGTVTTVFGLETIWKTVCLLHVLHLGMSRSAMRERNLKSSVWKFGMLAPDLHEDVICTSSNFPLWIDCAPSLPYTLR